MMSLRLVCLALCAGLLFQLGCSSDRPAGSGCRVNCSEGTPDGGGTPDAGQITCPTGKTACNGACVDTATDTHNCQGCGRVCFSGQICAASGCMTLPTACSSEKPCPAGSYCDASSMKCIAGCMTDTNCSPTQICEQNTCVTGCRTTEACPGGNICVQFMCQPSCHSDSDCPLGQECNLNSSLCVSGCSSDSRCPSGEVCDSGSCRSGCRSSSDCPGGQVCDSASRSCRGGCRDDSGCSNGEICSSSQMCVPGCRSDSGCGSGQICQSNQCVTGCRSNTACAKEQICNSSSHMCVAGCTTDSGCNSGRICVSGQCRDGCRTDANCPSGICDSTSLTCRGGCRMNSDCPVQQHCDTATAMCASGCQGDVNQCPVGQACVSYTNGTYGCSAQYCGSDFSSTECNGSQYQCYEIFEASQSYCRMTCSQSNDTCPSGYRCTLFTDNPSAPNFGSSYYFCAKKCRSNSDCTGSVMDLNNPSPCQCTSDGACRYGSATNTEECYGDSVSWGY